jgi:hypothetical protein
MDSELTHRQPESHNPLECRVFPDPLQRRIINKGTQATQLIQNGFLPGLIESQYLLVNNSQPAKAGTKNWQ